MKAPDKIYLQACGDCPGGDCKTCKFEDLAEVTWSEEKVFKRDIEYIRKDALVEWLIPLEKEYRERVKKGEMVSQIAGTFKQVIDKLNSM